MLFNCFNLFPSSISSIVFVCSSKACPNGEYVNLADSINLLWSDSKISSPARNSYLSILPNDDAEILAASLLILYCTFFCL